MFKKIILIWMLIFSSLFSSGDDFITTLPRKEKAYLDIEITKIKTETINITEIDLENKTITLKNKKLSPSEYLLLSEDFELFNSLFSVNGRLNALKKMTKQNNFLSFNKNDTNNEIIIKYDTVPSNFYAGVWNKNTQNLEKIYLINIDPLAFDLKYIYINTFGPVLYENADFNNDLVIEIASMETFKSGPKYNMSFLNENNIQIKTNNGTSINGNLYFKSIHNQGKFSSSIYDNLGKFKEYKIVLKIPRNEAQKIYSTGEPFKVFFNPNGAQIKVPPYNELVPLNNLEVFFSNFFEIKYFPPGHTIHIGQSSAISQNVPIVIGSINVRNINQNINILLSQNDFNVSVNGNVNGMGNGAIRFRSSGSSGFDDAIRLQPNSSYSGDIILIVPYQAINEALRVKHPVKTIPISLSGTPDNYSHILGHYFIAIDDGSDPLPPDELPSSLVLGGLTNGSIIIDHGTLDKGQQIYEKSSSPITLRREKEDELLTSDSNNVTISIENVDNFFIENPNSPSTPIKAVLTPSIFSLDISKQFGTFTVESYLEPNHVNAAGPGTYTGQNELTITIDN